jgi:hypothetical protein
MKIQKINPDNKGWYDLSPYWNWLMEISQEIHKQKDEFESTRPWNPNSHFIGNCGECTVTLATNVMFDYKLRISGQGNKADYEAHDAEVKCSTHYGDPDLKHPIGEKRWAKYFILVGLDTNRKRSKIFGWATAEMLKAGDIKNYGNGPQYTLDQYSLNEGLPPSFEV